jgi:hypothetical protein
MARREHARSVTENTRQDNIAGIRHNACSIHCFQSETESNVFALRNSRYLTRSRVISTSSAAGAQQNMR